MDPGFSKGGGGGGGGGGEGVLTVHARGEGVEGLCAPILRKARKLLPLYNLPLPTLAMLANNTNRSDFVPFYQCQTFKMYVTHLINLEGGGGGG